jgi:hypothetical protein
MEMVSEGGRKKGEYFPEAGRYQGLGFGRRVSLRGNLTRKKLSGAIGDGLGEDIELADST